MAGTGFRLFTSPDTVRAADVAFVRHERIPDPTPTGFAPFAPDLAVEIISPNEGDGVAWEEKLARYHDVGVKELLRFDPEESEGQRLRAWASCTLTRSKYRCQYGRSSASGVGQ